MSTLPGLYEFTTFGDLLRHLRRRAGLTQLELAEAVGYSAAHISRLEQNQRLPDVATVSARFSAALGLQDHPQTAARLVQLAAAAQREDAPALGQPPFKGLRHFDEEDAGLFFGREALLAHLVERVSRLADSPDNLRFLALIGPSGSGKSSVVRAGLLPALRSTDLAQGRDVRLFTPTARPLQALAAAASPRAGSQAPALAPRVLIVDQFEELFTFCRDGDERQAFVDRLMDAASSGDCSDIVLIALRADFYAHCAPYDRLRSALAARQEFIGAMTASELRRAIEGPAERGGWLLETGLVDLLLKDLSADLGRAPEPGALPLLSHALLETWQRRRGRSLTLSGYLATGGVRAAIAETAEAVYHDQLDATQRPIARHIFLRLTEVGADAVIDTRRRVPIAELIRHPDEAQAVRDVLTLLADARLVTTEDGLVEVAHEALIREWPTLQAWIEENRAGLRLHRQLTEAAGEWQRQGRDPDLLWRTARLAQASEWLAGAASTVNALEREFLDASQTAADRESAEREARRARELQAAQRLAEAERRQAEVERRRAEEQRLAAHNLHRRAIYWLATAVAAIILALVAAAFARQAMQNAARANAYANDAVTAEARAVEQQATAVAERNRAESQRLAADSAAVVQRHGSGELAALLALNALQLQYSRQASAALQQTSHFDFGLRLYPHAKAVYAVAVSPDGQYLLTGGADNLAHLWDIATGREVRSFQGHTGVILNVAFSPDGRSIVTGGEDMTARLWDRDTGAQLREFAGHQGFVNGVAFSPDGRYALTSSADNSARLWEAATGQLVRAFSAPATLNAAAFSPDGRYVLAGSDDHNAYLWEVSTGQVAQTFSGHITRVWAVAFSPDGRQVLTGSFDKTARLWDVASGRELRQFAGHIDLVKTVAFSPDGRFVLTGGRDTTARLWDAATGAELREFAAHAEQVNSVAFSPDGRYVFTGSWDGTARLWDTRAPEDPRLFTGHTNWVWSTAFSPDGKYALTGSYDSTARLWDAATGRTQQVFAGHGGIVFAVAFSPDGQQVLTGSFDKTARLWDVASGRELRQFAGHTDIVFCVGFSPDGRYAITGSKDATARVWEVATGRQVVELSGHASAVYSAAFSPDGRSIVTAGEDGTVRLWDVATGRELRRLSANARAVNSVAFSPDGKALVTVGDDQFVRLWDGTTGVLNQEWTGHTGPISTVAFSPNGRYLLTSSVDGTARLWDRASGQELDEYQGHVGSVWTAVFSPDGKFVLTGSEDNTARLWNTEYKDLISWVCSRVLRDLTPAERELYEIPTTSASCSP